MSAMVSSPTMVNQCYGCDYDGPQRLPLVWSGFTCRHYVGRWQALVPATITANPRVVDREMGATLPVEVQRTSWRDTNVLVMVTVQSSVDHLARFSIRWRDLDPSDPAPDEHDADGAWWYHPWRAASLCSLTQTTIPSVQTYCHWNVALDSVSQYPWDTVPIAPWHAVTDGERAHWIAQWQDERDTVILDELASPLIYGVPSLMWNDASTDMGNTTLPESMRTLLHTCIDSAFAWLCDEAGVLARWSSFVSSCWRDGRNRHAESPRRTSSLAKTCHHISFSSIGIAALRWYHHHCSNSVDRSEVSWEDTR